MEEHIVGLHHCSQTSLIWSGGERQSPLALTAEICEGRREGIVLREDFPLEKSGAMSRGEGECLCHQVQVDAALFITRTAAFPRFFKSLAAFCDSQPARQLACPANSQPVCPSGFPPSFSTHHQHTARQPAYQGCFQTDVLLVLVNTPPSSCLGGAKPKTEDKEKRRGGEQGAGGKTNNRSGAVEEV